MGNLKRDYNRFLSRNRDRGIPRLTLVIGVLSAVLYLMSTMTEDFTFANYLSFDPIAIGRGQVWRLFTYVLTFTFGYQNIFFVLLGVYFYYWIGNALESIWGRLRTNLYILSSILLLDLYAMILWLGFGYPIPLSGSYPLMALFLAVATLIPDQQVLMFMIFPVKMRWMALIDVALILYDLLRIIIQYAVPLWGTPYGTLYLLLGLAPLVPLLNYLLHFGRDVRRLFGGSSLRQRRRRTEFRQKSQAQPGWGPRPQGSQSQPGRSPAGQRPYRHKCTVCGRTDLTDPDLEFRYCSACKGYFCYCIEHIHNHTHVQ